MAGLSALRSLALIAGGGIGTRDQRASYGHVVIAKVNAGRLVPVMDHSAVRANFRIAGQPSQSMAARTKDLAPLPDTLTRFEVRGF